MSVGPLTYMSLPLTLAATAALGYLALVRALRWRKYDAVHRKYAYKRQGGSVLQSPPEAQPRSAEKAQTLTPEEAQEIVQLSLGYDMHYIMTMALSFALFKTYGIVSAINGLTQAEGLSGCTCSPPSRSCCSPRRSASGKPRSTSLRAWRRRARLRRASAMRRGGSRRLTMMQR